jgi:LysM repeat protein
MMNRFSTISFLIFLLFFWIKDFPAHAQTAYSPDTLAYPDFLMDCIQFQKREAVNEVWVVNFWASWSSNSLWEIPNLKKIQDQFKNKPVRFVGISVDKNEAVWLKQLNKLEMPWEQLRIARLADYNFLRTAFIHNSIPAFFLVNRQGKVRRVRDVSELQSLLVFHTKELPDQPWKKASSGNRPEKPAPPATTVPTSPPATPVPATTPADPRPASPAPTQWLTHTVAKGETLYAISRKYGVSVPEIKGLNGLTDNSIRIGQKLKIKGL